MHAVQLSPEPTDGKEWTTMRQRMVVTHQTVFSMKFGVFERGCALGDMCRSGGAQVSSPGGSQLGPWGSSITDIDVRRYQLRVPSHPGRIEIDTAASDAPSYSAQGGSLLFKGLTPLFNCRSYYLFAQHRPLN